MKKVVQVDDTHAAKKHTDKMHDIFFIAHNLQTEVTAISGKGENSSRSLHWKLFNRCCNPSHYL